MAKYNNFNAGKYKSTFDQMFGQGAYDQGISSAQETGRLKVEASLARKQYEEMLKEQEKRRKEAEKQAKKDAAKALPKADEGRTRTRTSSAKKDDDNLLDKLVGGLKKAGKEVNRFDDILTNALTFGLSGEADKRIQKTLDKKGSDVKLTEYMKPREDGNIVGKGADLLANLAGYTVGGAGAVQLLRGAGVTGKGINALSQAHKAGTVTKPILKKGALDAAKEGAIAGGGLTAIESAVRLGLNKEADTSWQKELGNVALGTALGGVLDPLVTAGMPALKMASRNAVDGAVGRQAARGVTDGLRAAQNSPVKAADLVREQMRQSRTTDAMLNRGGTDRLFDSLINQSVPSRNAISNLPTSRTATDARNIMQDISETAARKPRGVDAEENLRSLIEARRPAPVEAAPVERVHPTDKLIEELTSELATADTGRSLAIRNRLKSLDRQVELRKAAPNVDDTIPEVSNLLKQRDKLTSSPYFSHMDELNIRKIDKEIDDAMKKALEARPNEPEVAAASPLQQAMRDVEGTSPVRPDAGLVEPELNRSFIDRSVKTPKPDARTGLTKAQQQFTNDTAALRQIDEQMKSLDADGLMEYLNPKTLIPARSKQLASNSSLEKSMINAKGAHSVAANHVTNRFSPFLEGLNKSKTTSMEELGDYAFAKHGMTLLQDSAERKAMRDSLLEEVDTLKASLGADSDEVRAMQDIIDSYTDYTMPEGATYETLQAQMQKFESNPELVKHYEKFQELQQQNLKDMRDGGIVSDKLYDKLKDNATYISMHRNFDDISNTAGMASRRPQNTLERMQQGSEAMVKEPIQEAIRNAYLTKFNIEKNNALKVVEKFAIADKQSVMFKAALEPNSRTITMFKNGKPKYFEVPPELKSYVDNFGADRDPDILTNVLQKAAQMQRKLTTQYNLAFQLKSLVREPVQAMMTSRTAPTAVHAAKNTALGYVDALVGPQLQELTKGLPKRLQFNSYKQNWDKMGGTGFQYIRMSDDDLQRVAKEMLQDGTVRGSIRKLNPFRSLGKFGEKVEEGARLGEFRSAKNQGYADADAFYEATDITNYKRSGETTRALNKYVPFLNATIQGNSRVLRAFQEAPERTILRGATMLSTAAIGAYSMRFHEGVSDEQRRELDNLAQWEKDSYMHIPVPNSETIIAVPKAFAVGQMFMNPVERALDDYYNAVMKEESVPEHIKAGIKSTLKAFIPPYEFAGITTAMELKQNKSLFTGQEIESEFDRTAGVPKQDIEAYNQSWVTGAISDLINKMSFGNEEGIVSPAQIDYLVKDLTGTTGTQTLGIMDSLVSDNAPAKPLEDQLLKPVKQFEADPTRASGVYEELKKLAKKEKRENVSMVGMSEEEKNAERANRPLQNYEAAFKELNKELQAVRSDKSLSSEEKKDFITQIRKEQDELGTQAIDWYNSFN